MTSRVCVLRLCLACALLGAGQSHAQLVRENAYPIERNGLADLSSGMLLDATVTVLGHEFFAAFASAWREMDVYQRYSVSVIEAPNARFGTTIRVQARGRTVYQGLLRPNRQLARETAMALAGDVFRALLEEEAREALFRDPDLAPEELR